MKKLFALVLTLTLAVGLLAGCGGEVATATPTPAPAASAAPVATPAPDTDGTPVKTGLSMNTTINKSKDATADANGQAQTNAVLVAVTVDDAGVIDSCIIDTIQVKIDFDAAGALVTDIATEFESKNALGDAYGMRKTSAIGKEWNEQAAALAAYAVGKTAAEVQGIAVTDGKVTDADLAASVTVGVENYIAGIVAAVENATHMGAQKGDVLGLGSSTHMAKSKDATADADGLAQAYAMVTAATFAGDTITSCYIDSVQANVNFDATGAITTDLATSFDSKNILGDAYGMRKASAIGKEWNEQAAAFAAYATGKTVADVTGIALTADGAIADADLAASVTVGIDAFLTSLAKAAG